WVARERVDVACLQETRCRPEQVPDHVRAPRGWHSHFACADRPGYSGVCLYSKRAVDAVETSIGVRTMDREGRVQIARLGRLSIANVYFPNGSGSLHDNSRVGFKLRFYRRLHRVLEPLLAAG